jgi:TP901 family phage tail tape measure protein
VADRSVSVALIAKVQGFTAGIATAKKATQEFSADLDKLAKTHKDRFNQMTLATGGVGLALSAGFGLAVKSAMAFDKQMSEVSAVSDATGQSLGDLREAALKAGKDTAYSATEAAQAEAELAKAGISTADILNGGLSGALSLAAAGQMDLADAATIAAQTMNIFGLAGKDVGHIADVLAAGANKSAADMGTLGDALKQGGLVAHQTGLSFEDTTGVLAAFADRGLQGSDAGTSLKTMLQQLQAPSAKSAGLMRELGISAYDTAGNFVGITALAGQLQRTLGGLTQAQRDAALAQIFGSDATRAASVLYNQGAAGIQAYITSVNDSGAANRTAGQKMDNLAGDVEQLKGTLETLAITAGGGASSGLRTLTQAANGALGQFMALPAWMQTTLTLFGGISGGGLLAATGFVKVRQAGKDFLDTLREMGPTGEKTADRLGKIGSVAGKLTLLGGAALAGYEGVSALVNLINDHSGPVVRDVDAMTASLKEFAETGKVAGELARTFGTDLGKLSVDLAKVAAYNAAMAGVKSNSLSNLGNVGRGAQGANAPGVRAAANAGQANADLKGLDQSLTKLATNGGAAQAKIALDELITSQHLSSVQVTELMAKLPGYSAAARDAALANTGLAKGFGTAAANEKTLNDSLEESINKGLKLTDVWAQLNGALANTDQKALAANEAIEAVTQSFKDNGKAVDGSTDAALKNRIAVANAAETAAELAQAKYEETGSVEAANQVYQAYIGNLRKVMLAAGLTKQQVDALLGAYAQMPKAVSTDFSTPGLSTALKTANALYQITTDLNGKHVKITYGTDVGRSLNPYAQRWGGIHYAESGLLNAGVYSGGPLYGFAEPATGGEAFIPRRGDYGRSTGILDQAARWYGGRFVAGGRGGGGNLTITLVGGDAATRAQISGLRAYIQGSYGGNVQLALGQ